MTFFIFGAGIEIAHSPKICRQLNWRFVNFLWKCCLFKARDNLVPGCIDHNWHAQNLLRKLAEVFPEL